MLTVVVVGVVVDFFLFSNVFLFFFLLSVFLKMT